MSAFVMLVRRIGLAGTLRCVVARAGYMMGRREAEREDDDE